jgi:hypothetical protein
MKLRTQLRCNHCGVQLPDTAETECPGCHSDLAQVGIWSEVKEWGRTRKFGRARYIWLHGVLGGGGLLALGSSLGLALRGDAPWLLYALAVSSSLVTGYILGWWHWRSAEREYEDAVSEGRGFRPCL